MFWIRSKNPGLIKANENNFEYMLNGIYRLKRRFLKIESPTVILRNFSVYSEILLYAIF